MDEIEHQTTDLASIPERIGVQKKDDKEDMSYLLQLPHEVLHHIAALVGRRDLASLCGSCHALNNFIKGNNLLWKEHYLRDWSVRMDNADDHEQFDWEAKLKELTKVEIILNSSDESMKESSLVFIIRVISDFLKTTPPGRSRNYEFLARLFDGDEPALGQEDTNGRKGILTRSSLYSDEHRKVEFNRATSARGSVGLLSAKLHCLYGVPISEAPSSLNFFPYPTRTRPAETPAHAYARSRVYDMRNYNRLTTEWAPLMEDGSGFVDWEKMEAIMILLDYNIQLADLRRGDFTVADPELLTLWTRPFEGLEPKDGHVGDKDDKLKNSIFNSNSQSENELAEEDDDWIDLGSFEQKMIENLDLDLVHFDPYDVTGCWLRIVCYLDYNDFHSFNFPSRIENRIPHHQARPPIKTMEDNRIINMTLAVSRIETANEKGALPIVHFEGLSTLVDLHWNTEAISGIRGSVRQTPEGEVRWQTVSIFEGNEERWKSEGIQIGGLRSRRAVVGSWFDRDYSEGGPLGPTAFWKIHNLPASCLKKRGAAQ